MAVSGEQSLLALQTERSLEQVAVHRYRLTIEGDFDESTALQATRHGANSLNYNNQWASVTDLGPYEIVSLAPLNCLQCSHQDKQFTAVLIGTEPLMANDAVHRAAIERLLNQELFKGAQQLANKSGGALKASYGAGRKVQLVDNSPSERIQIRNQYLEAYQTLTMTPDLLPCGTALISMDVRHQLLPFETITVDWIIRNRPQWVPNIRRVRHCYLSLNTGVRATAEFKGLAEAETPSTLLKLRGGDVTLLEYHKNAKNIRPEQLENAAHSAVVNVSYGPKNSALHLAALLQPMIDFETLRNIEPRLLEAIARKLKWPVNERVQACRELAKGLYLPRLDTGLIRIKEPERYRRKIPLNLKLQFHNGQTGTAERELLQKKAYQPMDRPLVAMLGVGELSPQKLGELEKHFGQIKTRCQQWGAVPGIRWSTVSPAKNEHDLDSRLSKRNLDPSLLVIGIDETANKEAIRNVAFRHGHATQFMRLDRPHRTYNDAYYNNLAAGVLSKGGGIICALENMPGDADLFVGLDMGGVKTRVPGSAFLFNRNGSQLGWQLAEAQSGERLHDETLQRLLERSVRQFSQTHEGQMPSRMVLHRDGKFYESMDVIQRAEESFGFKIDVLEIIKSGAAPLMRRQVDPSTGRSVYLNPELGDAFELVGMDEMILATYSGHELGKSWGNKVTVRPLRLRKRYGETPLDVLAAQVVALSRIHGASLYRHPRLPVTTHHADRFATLRQECDLDDLSKMDRMCPVYL